MNATQRRKRATTREAKTPPQPRLALVTSAEERALLDAAAKMERLPISTWLRQVGLKEAGRLLDNWTERDARKALPPKGAS